MEGPNPEVSGFPAQGIAVTVEFGFSSFFMPIELARQRLRFNASPLESREAGQARQFRALKNIVAHAYANVPHYRRSFDAGGLTPSDLRSIGDLGKFPLLSKPDVQQNFSALVARNAGRFHPAQIRTSGSTGLPLTLLLDRRTNAMEFAYYWRYWNAAGYRLGDTFAEFSSSFFMKRGERDRLFHWQPWCRRLLVNSLALSPGTAGDIHRAMGRHGARFLKGLPSVLLHFVALLEGRAPMQLKAVFTTGEMLLDVHRRSIEAAFGCRAYDSYGQMERIVAVSECPSGSMHVNTDYGLLELVQDDRIPPGVAGERLYRMIGTGLHNFSMPLIRYDLGDIASVDPSAGPCPCGWSFPVIKRIYGRHADVVTTPDGRLITTLFLVLVEVPGIRWGEIIQNRPDGVVARIAAGPEFDEDRMVGAIKSMIGAKMKVEIERLPMEYSKVHEKWRPVKVEVKEKQ
jgi:phenylacetate-CoA ligase